MPGHLRNSTSPARLIWCRGKVESPKTKPELDLVLFPNWVIYDVREAYEKAQRKHDPLLSPHGFFRHLAYRNITHAREFLEKFGPLEGFFKRNKWESYRFDPVNPPTEPVNVEIHSFWRDQLEFCHTVNLWESLNEKEALVASWQAIVERHLRGKFVFVDTRSALKVFPWEVPNEKGLVSRLWEMPYRLRAEETFYDWAKNTPFAALRSATLDFVRNQLNNHSSESKIVWEFGWERSGTKLRPMIQAISLLQMIWELFGHDTAQSFWRQCPHCQRMFYPKRRDQFYCTPRQQALASKREYAAWRRALEKKSKKQPRRTKKGDEQ